MMNDFELSVDVMAFLHNILLRRNNCCYYLSNDKCRLKDKSPRFLIEGFCQSENRSRPYSTSHFSDILLF